MALLTDRKFIHFNRKSDFEALLNANAISDKQIVFLKDAQEIWTHGTYYNSVEQFLDETNKDSTNAISAAAVYKALTDDEKTIAAALNDLNDRIENLDIPSKVSDLTDDLSLATLEYVDDKLDDVLGVSAAGVEAFVNMTRDEDTATGILTEIANKAPKTNAVNGAPLSNTESYFYGTSTTAAATALKEVSIPSITSLKTGQIIVVKPTITSTVANSTIKLNNFTAYPMRYNNAAITTSTDSIVWAANIPSIWVFDGTYWVFLGHGLDSNTTYSAMTQAEATTGTATTARTISAKVLHDTIVGTANLPITNEKYGNGFALQTDNGSTQNITASLTDYVLTKNGRVSVVLTHNLPYGATLNINNTGAKTIRDAAGQGLTDYNKRAFAGDIITVVYDGTNYRLVDAFPAMEYSSYIHADPIILTLTDDTNEENIKLCTFTRNSGHPIFDSSFGPLDMILYNDLIFINPQHSEVAPGLEMWVFSSISENPVVSFLRIFHLWDPTYQGGIERTFIDTNYSPDIIERVIIKEDLIVDVTNTEDSIGTTNYSVSEILTLLEAGRNVYIKFNNLQLPLVFSSPSESKLVYAMTVAADSATNLNLPPTILSVVLEGTTATLYLLPFDPVAFNGVKTIDGNDITGSGDLTVFPQIEYGDLNSLEDVGIYRVGTGYICLCTLSGPSGSPFYSQTLYGAGGNIQSRSGNSLPITSPWTTLRQSIKSLNTNNTSAQTVNASEAIEGTGTINLHKVSKTGSYSDLIKPSGGIPSTDFTSAVLTSLGKADTAIQEVKVNDTALTPDANKAVNISITNEGLGNGYAIQTDNGQTQNITASLTGYVLTINGRVSVKFNHDATYTPTLNINGTGAKTIKLADGSSLYQDYDYIKGGDIATFVYDGTYYRLVNVQRPKEFDSFLVPDPIELTLTDDSSSGIKVCSFSRNGATVHLPFWSTDTVLYNGVVYSDPQWSDAGPNLETYVFSNTSTEGIIQYLTIYHQFDPTYMGMVDEKWFVVTDEIVKTISIGASVLSEFYEPSSLSNEDLFLEPGDSYETAFSKLEKTINDNENITSAALTDLDSRLNLLHLPQSLDDIPDGSTRKLSDYATTTLLATKQDALVSGTNIKTINNESLLGSGNITIQGGSGGDTNVIETIKINGTALTPDANKAVNITSVPASIVTQDATHRFVSDTEKTTWNGKLNALQCYTENSGNADIDVYSNREIELACLDDVTAWNRGRVLVSERGVELNYKDGYAGTDDEIENTVTLSHDGFKFNNKQIATVDQIPSAVTESTVSGWGFTKNAGTITGITMNGASKGTSGVVDLGTVITSETALSKGTTTGNGNAVTDISVSGHQITLTKGTTFLTSHQGIKTLKTDNTTAQSTSSSEAIAGSGTINLHKVAKTGTYSDLIGKPTIPTVNNATLTIQKNGTTVNTFTANASSNVTANIQVNELPTVSSSDNGKVLMVVNGAWSLVTPTAIYSGTSEPDSNTGNNGDLYLQTS